MACAEPIALEPIQSGAPVATTVEARDRSQNTLSISSNQQSLANPAFEPSMQLSDRLQTNVQTTLEYSLPKQLRRLTLNDSEIEIPTDTVCDNDQAITDEEDETYESVLVLAQNVKRCLENDQALLSRIQKDHLRLATITSMESKTAALQEAINTRLVLLDELEHRAVGLRPSEPSRWKSTGPLDKQRISEEQQVRARTGRLSTALQQLPEHCDTLLKPMSTSLQRRLRRLQYAKEYFTSKKKLISTSVMDSELRRKLKLPMLTLEMAISDYTRKLGMSADNIQKKTKVFNDARQARRLKRKLKKQALKEDKAVVQNQSEETGSRRSERLRKIREQQQQSSQVRLGKADESEVKSAQPLANHGEDDQAVIQVLDDSLEGWHDEI